MILVYTVQVSVVNKWKDDGCCHPATTLYRCAYELMNTCARRARSVFLDDARTPFSYTGEGSITRVI